MTYNISATVVADSIYCGARITTLECIFPSFLLCEFSDCDISVTAQIIPGRMFAPAEFMRADGETLRGAAAERARRAWRLAADDAAQAAERLAKIGVDAGTRARLLLPHSNARAILTACNFGRFFTRAARKGVPDDLRSLSAQIFAALAESKPRGTDCHAPYIHTDGWREIGAINPLDAIQSVARCAHFDKESDLDYDRAFFWRIIDMNTRDIAALAHVAWNTGLETGAYNLSGGWQSLLYVKDYAPAVLETWRKRDKSHTKAGVEC